jgi:CheY-like chemotaxis protein
MDDELPTITRPGPLVIVDDDELEVMLVQRYLALTGVERRIKAFNTGGAFLEYLEQVQAGEAPMPAVVLLDIRMPQMDGYEVLQQTRARESFRRVPPVLMFSNSRDESDIEHSRALGADGYQVKPANQEEYRRFFEQLFAA